MSLSSTTIRAPIDLSSSSSAYTDLNALSQLKQKARTDKDAALPEVARQFEAVMIAMLIKNMRQASIGDAYFDSSAMDNYKSMYDQQLSMELSKGKGIGLADSIVRQLQQRPSSDNADDQTLAGELTLPSRRRFDLPSPSSQALPLLQTFTPAGLSQGVDLTQQGTSDSDTQATVSGTTQHNLAAPDISTPEKFVNNLWDMAEKSAKELGVKPEVLLAQAALETGWGKHMIKDASKNSHNLFNIKADSRWDGDKIEKVSLEYENNIAVNRHSYFRAYDNLQQSFDDYVNFIQSNPRYKKALEKPEDSAQYLHLIHQAGYATDPQYADKILQVMSKINRNLKT